MPVILALGRLRPQSETLVDKRREKGRKGGKEIGYIFYKESPASHPVPTSALWGKFRLCKHYFSLKLPDK